MAMSAAGAVGQRLSGRPRGRQIDAFFWSGASRRLLFLDLASSVGITAKLIPHDEVVLIFNAIWAAAVHGSSWRRGAYPGRTLHRGHRRRQRARRHEAMDDSSPTA